MVKRTRVRIWRAGQKAIRGRRAERALCRAYRRVSARVLRAKDQGLPYWWYLVTTKHRATATQKGGE